jgi:hypothetical protein
MTRTVHGSLAAGGDYDGDGVDDEDAAGGRWRLVGAGAWGITRQAAADPAVGTNGLCSPRHQSSIEPSVLELVGIL